jgi:exodeoxyribonuclease V alpha subunit
MTIPYPRFLHAQQQLSNIEAVDYFFAKEITQSLTMSRSQNETQHTHIFHVLMALSESLRAGHSCLPLSVIANSTFGHSSDEQGIVIHHGFIFADITRLTELFSGIVNEHQQQAIVYHQGKLYLRRYFHFEQALLGFITEKSEPVQSYANQDIKQCLEQLFPETAGDNNTVVASTEISTEIDWQKVAVANAINKNFSIIAGGPGTGKTYTVTKLLAALVMLNANNKAKKIALVAPTGKAAQRLSESITNALQGFQGMISADVLAEIPQQAQTLHRLLGVIPNSVNFRHHQDNLLAIDVLLIDEVSMVDLPLMVRVFRALPSHCQVILLGDADQLPSVAAGSVLHDLAPKPHQGFSLENQQYLADVSGYSTLPKRKKPSKTTELTRAADHVVFLEKSRRFDSEGGIGKVANYVINGQFNESWQLFTEQASLNDNTNNNGYVLRLLGRETTKWLAELVKHYYQPIFSLKNLAEAFKQLQKFRILCATRVGVNGVESFNEQVHNLLVQQGIINAFETRYFGQPIMINVNHYPLGLYNGDIGLIWKNDTGHLMAVFEQANGEYKWVNPSRLPQHETVYAMTIHKTQGSEFEHVALVLPDQSDNKLLSRELMYTGITRAKKKLSVACLANVWRHGVSTKTSRYSGIDLYKK